MDADPVTEIGRRMRTVTGDRKEVEFAARWYLYLQPGKEFSSELPAGMNLHSRRVRTQIARSHAGSAEAWAIGKLTQAPVSLS